MKTHVTMVEIARRAGVSTAAVSMSLRNKANISPETRERIVAIARELGYQPNPYVSALMRSRRRGRPLSGRPVLGLVCALERADSWKNSPSLMRRQIREGAIERATKHGYQCQEFWLHQDGMTPERFSRMLHARGIHGILMGPRPDREPSPALIWEYFSAVSLGVPLRTPTLPTVCNDHYFSAWRAVQECQRLGYRRPGLVMRDSHRHLFQGRVEAGFFTAQLSLPGLEQTTPFFVENLEDAALFPLKDFKRWLKDERVDVIVTLGGDVIERVLQQLKLRVPRDIGFASLSCPGLGARHSGICQDGRLIGATAIDLLVGLVERDEKGPPEQTITTMVEGVWNAGETLKDKRPALAREVG